MYNYIYTAHIQMPPKLKATADDLIDKKIKQKKTKKNATDDPVKKIPKPKKPKKTAKDDSVDKKLKPKKKNNRMKKQVDMSKNHEEDNLEYTEILEEYVIDSKKYYIPIINGKLVDGYIYHDEQRVGVTRYGKIIFFWR